MSSSASADNEHNETNSVYEFLPTLDELDSSDPRPNGRKARPSSATASALRPQKSRRKMTKGNYHNQSKGIDMFEKVVKENAHQDGPATKHRDRFADQVEFFNNLERLRPMMKEESLDRCFQFFLDRVWSHTDYRNSPMLKSRAIVLLQKVAMEKAKDMYNDKWPSMAQITQIFLEISSLNGNKVVEMIFALVESIPASDSMRADHASVEAAEKALARKQELLEDLIETWIVFSRCGLNPDESALSTSQEAQFRLPEINETRLKSLAKRRDLLGALSLIFGRPFTSTFEHIHAATIATFVLLLDPTHSSLYIRQKAKPLLVSVARVLAAVRIPQSALAKIFEHHPQILWYVMKSWSPLIYQLHRWSHSPTCTTLELENRIMSGNIGEAVAVDPKHFQTQLSSALLMGDVESVETVWMRYWGKDEVPPRERAIDMRDHPAMFNTFIGAFTALGRPQRAVDVWDSMIRVGIEATLETWTAMIEGFKKARNPVGLEGVWKKLVASGIQLDQKVWRARISGLMHCREPQAGLQALKELAEQSTQPDGVPLTIESVNAAVVGLIRLNAMVAAKDVLRWASKYDVRPDVFTYNLLLRPLLRDGEKEQAEELLQLMRAQSIEPDAATFTAFFEGIIVASRNKTHEQRMSLFRQLIDDMEGSGVKVNIDAIGRMVSLLIREGQQTMHHTRSFVGAILRYAEKKGLRVSRHIYTMLVDYYFSQSPPALEEVNELIMGPKGLHLGLTGGLDRVFWERVVGGFAAAGDVDRAFGLFQQIHNLGTALTLGCLESLLRGLVNQGKMDEARQLVATVAEDRRKLKQHQEEDNPDRGRFWRHGFWGFARDCNLLSLPEQGPEDGQ